MEPVKSAGKKKRAQNWSPEEKEILRLLIAEQAHIIEKKCTKTATTIQKNKEWGNITSKFNEIANAGRTEAEVKLVWKRMKLSAKANVSAHRAEVLKTGGGEKPPSPSIEDQEIMAIAPYDFVVEINDYDSDKPVCEEPTPSSSTLQATSTSQASSLAPNVDAPVQEVPVNQEGTPAKEIPKCLPKGKGKGKGKKSSTRCTDDLRQQIVDGNIDYKKKHLLMLQEEHEINMKIAHLKVKKLELEISILENKQNLL